MFDKRDRSVFLFGFHSQKLTADFETKSEIKREVKANKKYKSQKKRVFVWFIFNLK